jgi:hypothetical protein
VGVACDASRRAAVGFMSYAQRCTSAGGMVAGWPVNGMLVCNATGDQVVPWLARDATTGIFVMWSDQRNANYDVYAQHFTASGGAPTVGVPFEEPGTFEAVEAAPNPLTTQTVLSFRLAVDAPVSAMIVDVQGRRVRELAGGAFMSSGTHTLLWDGRDESGASVSGGIYMLVLHAGADMKVAKLAVLR